MPSTSDKRPGSGLLGQLKNTFIKALNALVDIGLSCDPEYKDVLESDVWPKNLVYRTTQGDEIHVTAEPSEKGSDTVDIGFKNSRTKSGFKKRNVRMDDIVQLILDNKDKLGIDPDASVQPVETSMKFIASFRKIVGSDDITAQLCRICADTTMYPTDALAAIHSILDNDEFVEQLPADEETFYTIADDGSDYSVELCEACETSQFVSFSSILGAMYCALVNIQSIHWNTAGSEFHSVHMLSDDCIEMLRSEIDELAELCAQTQGCAPNPGTFAFTASPLCVVQPAQPFELSCDEALTALMTELDEVYAMIELHYGNFDHAVQSLLDNFLLDIGKKSHFFAKRQIAE